MKNTTKLKTIVLLLLLILNQVATPACFGVSKPADYFSSFLTFFSPIPLPLSGSKADSVYVPQKQRLIPLEFIKPFVNPLSTEKKSPYIAMGRIAWKGNRVFLLIGEGSMEWGPIKIYLMAYTREGQLLQKLSFDNQVYIRNQWVGYINKDYSIVIGGGYVDHDKKKFIPATYKFRINKDGNIVPLTNDRWGFLEDMTKAGQMRKKAKQYYECLNEGHYKLVSVYFSPKTTQWLGLKNVSNDKVGQEAHRFLSTKKNVFYKPDFSATKINGNQLTIPVSLGWNDYKAKVTAHFTFNNRYEITHFQEKF